MKLLDLFCGAGGAAMGYHRVGFEVAGVDINPQPHYPFEFHQADALTYPLDGFDVIHASPPCQRYSITRFLHKRNHPDLIPPIRKNLIKSGKPFIIENVEGAPLTNYVLLCGSTFPDLRVYRHRLFECHPQIFMSPGTCNHDFSIPASRGKYHTLYNQKFITCVGHNFRASDGRLAMGIDWMTREELSQAIPPAYTEWIGKQLMSTLGRAHATS